MATAAIATISSLLSLLAQFGLSPAQAIAKEEVQSKIDNILGLTQILLDNGLAANALDALNGLSPYLESMNANQAARYAQLLKSAGLGVQLQEEGISPEIAVTFGIMQEPGTLGELIEEQMIPESETLMPTMSCAGVWDAFLNEIGFVNGPTYENRTQLITVTQFSSVWKIYLSQNNRDECY